MTYQGKILDTHQIIYSIYTIILTMVWLLYFGRLEKEKGFDGIIEMIELFEKNKQELPCEIFVFGSWSGEVKIQELANKNKKIHFFWRQNLTTIKRYIENCSYCLMPSECLESFGLSALNAMKRWLPVIWYAKWWLQDFIEPKFDLNLQTGHTTGQKLYHLVKQLNTSSLKPQASNLHEYSKDNRVVRFHSLAGKEVKKIIIVSDFINKIWGIETYINDVKELLEQHGYEIELCWWTVPSWPIGKLAKYLWIITGLGNFWEAIKLQKKIKKIKPDLIRYNSVMRYLGWMPLQVSKKSSAKKRMMFHDLWYFAPFPSTLFQEDQIRTPFTLSNFMQTQATKNPLKKLAMFGKYISLYLIKKQIQKKVDTCLVPSNFMKDILHKSYDIKNEKIIVLPHFIQE